MICGSAAAAPAFAYKPDASAPRSAVPEKYKWDISPLFQDEAGWEAESAQARVKLAAIAVHYL